MDVVDAGDGDAVRGEAAAQLYNVTDAVQVVMKEKKSRSILQCTSLSMYDIAVK